MTIPKEVKLVIKKLQSHKFEAYIVGGCVRDILLGKKPNDWDVATNAKPEEIGKIFLKSYTDNRFGTVTVQIQKSKSKSQNDKLKIKNDKIQKLKMMDVEVTTYRTEEKYTDKRHPDSIHWAKSINEDLSRRDFTVNALALSEVEGMAKIIDPFGGQKDLKNKIIQAVGNPKERFNEDALRLMRAVRFATVLNSSGQWKIEPKTYQALKEQGGLLQFISKERIRDEFLKIIMAENASQGIELLRKTGLLKYIIPELEEGFGVSQNKHHVYDVYEHSLLSLKYAAKKNFNKCVRLAALLHDIAKPRVKEGEGPDATFYNHEIVGAKMTVQILSRLKFSKKDIEKIVKLVRYHLFYYNVDEVGEASIRRLVRRVGPENMEELLQVRMADRIGSGVPKAEPYKLRHLRYLIEKVSQDPISVKMLKVRGDDVMKILNIQPGPKIGQILDILLGEVLEEPEKNKKEHLEKKIKEIRKLTDKKLQDLSKKAKESREKIETKRDEMTKKKYWVT